MPTKVRYVRIGDEIWLPAQERAAGDGIDVSAIIRAALERYAAGVAETKPDDVFYTVQVRTVPRSRKRYAYNDMGEMSEQDARKLYRQLAKTKDVRLVRREEFVIDEATGNPQNCP